MALAGWFVLLFASLFAGGVLGALSHFVTSVTTLSILLLLLVVVLIAAVATRRFFLAGIMFAITFFVAGIALVTALAAG